MLPLAPVTSTLIATQFGAVDWFELAPTCIVTGIHLPFGSGT